MTARITALYRYPVKGFSPEPLQEVSLSAGSTFPWDRAFAIENGPSGFDPEHPVHLPKIQFLMLMKNERMAEFQTRFDEDEGTFFVSKGGESVLQVSLRTEEGRSRLEDWIRHEFSKDLRGEPRLLSASDFSFSDLPSKVIHLVNLESLRALAAEIGRPIDPLRFRPNIIVDGVPAFEEFDWTESRVLLPDITLNGESRTQRCAATNVDPSNGERDLQIPRTLLKRFGHSDFGIYLSVASSGTLSVGDDVRIEQKQDAALPF